MTTRLGWVLEGLRTGVVTTHYPTRFDPSATAGVRVWPQVHPDRCRADAGCDACTKVCLPGALTLVTESQAVSVPDRESAEGRTPGRQEHGSTTLVLDLGKCIGCSLCAQLCPHEALTMVSDVEVASRDTASLRQILSLHSKQSSSAITESR